MLDSASKGFPRHLRLRSHRDFQTVYRQGKKISNHYFILWVCSNHLQHPRLGMSVSKRHIPLAVQRNRIKRLIRESFRVHQALLPALDIIVITHTASQQLNNAQLFLQLEQQWQKLRAV